MGGTGGGGSVIIVGVARWGGDTGAGCGSLGADDDVDEEIGIDEERDFSSDGVSLLLLLLLVLLLFRQLLPAPGVAPAPPC